jgi:hypothetical protein
MLGIIAGCWMDADWMLTGCWMDEFRMDAGWLLDAE